MNTEIHHIAAISSDMQRTIRFYTGILGLQVTHKHAEFEGPKVCHFHWSEELQSYMTFFHCPELREDRQATSPYTVSFSVDHSSLEYWMCRFKIACIPFSRSSEAFDQQPVLLFNDPDGLPLKLVFTTADKRDGIKHPSIPINFCIKGLYGLEIHIMDQEHLPPLFNKALGWMMHAKHNRTRYSRAGELNGCIDLVKIDNGVKSNLERSLIHHVAFAITELESYTRVLSYIDRTKSWSVSRWRENDVLSIYFQIPEGMLFEILLCPRFSINRNPFLQFIPQVAKKKAEVTASFF
jgi:catechol 2,3-dioxygenase-like lactoylglutathione lyase family enzyme